MGEIIYKMSQELYDDIKYPKGKREKARQLSKEEIVEYVNKTFGLLGTVTEVVVG